MKSLEQVIKQKCKFLGNTKSGEENYFNLYERCFFDEDYENLYVSNDEVKSENIITFLKEMKPLIVFLFSCIRYDEEANDTDEETGKLHCKLEFHIDTLNKIWDTPVPNSEIDLSGIFNESLHWYHSPLSYIRCIIYDLETDGHYTTFDKYFNFTIKIGLMRTDLERFIYNIDNIDFEDFTFKPNIDFNKNKIENLTIPINKQNTFKCQLCVICTEKIPNVLFCVCGHICLCEECNEIKEIEKCPLCKTENKIKRII